MHEGESAGYIKNSLHVSGVGFIHPLIMCYPRWLTALSGVAFPFSVYNDRRLDKTRFLVPAGHSISSFQHVFVSHPIELILFKIFPNLFIKCQLPMHLSLLETTNASSNAKFAENSSTLSDYVVFIIPPRSFHSTFLTASSIGKEKDYP